ncbi:MAG TPA: response regulator [Gaiellaceae bacterium]|nr:response regulator [Gaiellaceae bacterium]
MKLGIRGRLLATSAVLALIVAGALAFQLTTIGHLRDSSSRANHSSNVLASSYALDRVLIDLWTSPRAYVITREQSFLQPWHRALAEFPARSRQLEALVGDNPAQEQRARTVVLGIEAFITDYSRPYVARITRGPLTHAQAVSSTAEGKRRVDAIQTDVDAFENAEHALENARNASAHASGHEATLIGIAALGGWALLVLLFAAFLGREIVNPIRRAVGVARTLQGGDLSARLVDAGPAELGELGAAINDMAASLQESRDELESQNAELELQTSELEDQQERLLAANDELAAQRSELQRSRDELAREKGRIEAFYALAERLAGETDRSALARAVLHALSDAAGADAGALYLGDGGEGLPVCLAVVGLDHALVGSPLAGGGVAGRALDESRLVTASYGQASLRIASVGGEVAVRHELGVPILHGGRPLGVALLARADDQPFDPEAQAVIRHLADQAAAALAHTLQYAEAQRLARINNAVLEAVTDSILLVDFDGRIILENTAKQRLVENVLPYGSGETIWEQGRGVAAHTTDPDAYIAALDAIRADPERESVDVYQLEDGRWIQRNTTPVRDADNELIGRLLVVREVTSEREVERLARVNSAVLDATRDGILLVNSAGSAEVVNHAYEELLDEMLPGCADHESVWERAAAFADYMRDRDAYLRPLRAIEEDPDYRGEDEFELLSGRWVKRYTTPVYAADGQLVGRLFMLRETTAEREAEQMKSDLVATVSHELRTPLAGVLGFAELLVTRDLDVETSHEYLRTIHNEALRLTGLINDFLDLQRIESGGFTLSIEPLELGALLRRTVALYGGQSNAHTITLELDDDPLRVAADEERIVQLVGNLLSNAIKYSPAGGPVVVTADRVNGVVARVSVEDRGLGIPLVEQRNVFKKFFRVDSSDTREIGGTGLGLALCHEIVETHGGRIGFESEEGRGSTFWFELPVESARSVVTARRALVVEDEEPAAALLTEHLADAGCAVEIVSTGEDALASIRRNPPALVCLDMVLAGELDGWQVLSELKRDRSTASVPVIICTGRNGRDRASALGASDFLTKPFSRAQLLAAIERVLPGRRGLVLVVDDDASVRRLVVETLQESDLGFGEAGDGEEALAAIAVERPDAIVLDLMLPKLDGFALLERLHADPQLRLIPVIVLTGRRLSAAERSDLRMRTVSLFEKSSYSAKELRTLIERALAQQPLDRLEQL